MELCKKKKNPDPSDNKQLKKRFSVHAPKSYKCNFIPN